MRRFETFTKHGTHLVQVPHGSHEAGDSSVGLVAAWLRRDDDCLLHVEVSRYVRGGEESQYFQGRILLRKLERSFVQRVDRDVILGKITVIV